jgi:hypothetical protein
LSINPYESPLIPPVVRKEDLAYPRLWLIDIVAILVGLGSFGILMGFALAAPFGTKELYACPAVSLAWMSICFACWRLQYRLALGTLVTGCLLFTPLLAVGTTDALVGFFITGGFCSLMLCMVVIVLERACMRGGKRQEQGVD